MSITTKDPDIAGEIRPDRPVAELGKYDEVWDGEIVVMPLPNNEHQKIIGCLQSALMSVFGWDSPNQILPGINLSDLAADWLHNYREPDFVVFLEGTHAVDHGTHWQGGPDFVVEIVSPDDTARQKLPFYASIGTKEVLIIDRYPWRLELYQLHGDKLERVGVAKPGDGQSLASGTLPVTFGLRDGEPRPQLTVTHGATGQEWAI